MNEMVKIAENLKDTGQMPCLSSDLIEALDVLTQVVDEVYDPDFPDFPSGDYSDTVWKAIRLLKCLQADNLKLYEEIERLSE